MILGLRGLIRGLRGLILAYIGFILGLGSLVEVWGGDGWTDRQKPEKIAPCGIIGHRALQGRCPKEF